MSVSGHVFRVEGSRRPVWRAKYRLPDGRQVQKTIGPAWTERGRPPTGFFTRRLAEDWLRSVLDEARRGELPGLVRTGVTFASVCEDYLAWLERDRERKPNTLRDYRSIIRAHLLPAFGSMAVEDISREYIEAFQRRLEGSNRTKVKVLTVLHGALKRARRVHGLQYDPMALVEKPIQRRKDAGLAVFSPEEVMALVRAAASEQDGAIFLTAAFTGLRRGELVALRWRDVDFERSHVRVTASFSEGELTTPKSGRARAVPMSGEVAEALASLASRERFTGDDDLVSPASTAAISTPPRSTAATRPRSREPACARCDSTTCATRSARASLAAPRSCRSRSGWATRTSTRRCSTSITRRGPRTRR